MTYAAASFWIIVAALLAAGVQRLWLGLLTPRTLDALLLPGTLIARIGHVVALLITGSTPVEAPPDDRGPPPMPKPKLALIGPVLVALVPTLGLGAALYVTMRGFGRPALEKLPTDLLATSLPVAADAGWQQLRDLITLAEKTLAALFAGGWSWRVIAFTYLLVALSVRLAPLPGNLRGHLAAIIALGAGAALVATVHADTHKFVEHGWPFLRLTLGTLVLTLMASLAARGAAVLWRSITMAK